MASFPFATGFAAAARPGVSPVGLAGVLRRWQDDPRVARNLTLDETLPGRDAALRAAAARPRAARSPRRSRARGIRELYTHQREAFEQARAGRDVVVATPTASGKSLCYNLPVLDALAARPGRARALPVPDQGARARSGGGAARADARRGPAATARSSTTATRPATRAARRASAAACVLTNPDMLHAGILPHHADWARAVPEPALRRHRRAAHVPRRVRLAPRQRAAAARCASRASTARSRVFICASATIGNPREHAARMLGARGRR